MVRLLILGGPPPRPRAAYAALPRPWRGAAGGPAAGGAGPAGQQKIPPSPRLKPDKGRRYLRGATLLQKRETRFPFSLSNWGSAGVFPPRVSEGGFQRVLPRPLSLPGILGYSSHVVALVFYYTAVFAVWQGLFSRPFPQNSAVLPCRTRFPLFRYAGCPASPGRPALSRG